MPFALFVIARNQRQNYLPETPYKRLNPIITQPVKFETYSHAESTAFWSSGALNMPEIRILSLFSIPCYILDKT